MGTVIDLAPKHKQGLQLANPVLLGGGSVGYGEALFLGLNVSTVGGLVVGPIMRHSSGGSARPRVVESNGTFVMHSGFQNRGVSSTIKRYEPVWSRLDCPIIPQIADSQPELLLQVTQKLNDAFYDGVPFNGIELLLPQNSDEDRAETLVATVSRNTDLPLIVNLPLLSADYLAAPAVYAGAHALVVGQPPQGLLHRAPNQPWPDMQFENSSHGKPTALPVGQSVVGQWQGPGLFPQMVETLAHIRSLNLDCALIGAGGIHTVAQAKQVLVAGATAFQLDSVVWVEPGMVEQIVAGTSVASGKRAGLGWLWGQVASR